jgi:hypothetical protein
MKFMNETFMLDEDRKENAIDKEDPVKEITIPIDSTRERRSVEDNTLFSVYYPREIKEWFLTRF